LIEEAGMDFFEHPLQKKYGDSKIPRYMVKVRNTLVFEDKLKPQRDVRKKRKFKKKEKSNFDCKC
jgi:hypothetical protein